MIDDSALRELEARERQFAMFIIQTNKSLAANHYGSLFEHQHIHEYMSENYVPREVRKLVECIVSFPNVWYGICSNCGMHAPLAGKGVDAVCLWGCPGITKKEEPKVFKHPDLATCIKSGDHLTQCNDDGYCALCGEQVSPEDEDYADAVKEPATLQLYNVASAIFELSAALDGDHERCVRMRSYEKTSEGHVAPGAHVLLLDSEEVSGLFKFSYEWLRAGHHNLPILELLVDPVNTQSVDMQAPGAPVIGVQFDHERNLYQILKLVGNGTWNEVTSVSASPASRQQNGLTCPECQGGPIYPDARGLTQYNCGHCDTTFILPDRPHDSNDEDPLSEDDDDDEIARRMSPTGAGPEDAPLDEGKPPRETLLLPVSALLRASYDTLDEDGRLNTSSHARRFRQVVALGRPKDDNIVVGCVLNDVGKLVVASSLPGFRGMDEDDS
jgi:hypothetical protein